MHMQKIQARKPETHSQCVSTRHYFATGTVARRYRRLFIVVHLLYHASVALCFILPNSYVSKDLSEQTSFSKSLSMDTYPIIIGNSFQYHPRAKIAKNIVLLLDKKTKDDMEEERNEEEEVKSFSVLKRLGSKVISSIRKSNETSADETVDDESNEGRRRGWFARVVEKKKRNEEETENEEDKYSGIFSVVANTLKLKRKTDDDQARDDETTAQSNTEPRSVSPFKKPNIDDPFKSEITLATELRKQKALDSYISGESNQIPQEFLPEVPKDGSLGIDQALATLDDSMAYVREKIKELRLNTNDEDNPFFLTPKQEEQRLNKIRKDLEIRRKQLLIEQENRKKEKSAKDKATAEKVRIAVARSKKEKEKRQEKMNKSLGVGTLPFTKSGKISDQSINDGKIEPDNTENQSLDIQKTWAGTIVDGVVSGATSAVSNTWQLIRSTATKNADEEWIPVCPKTRVSPGEIYPVVAGGLDLLVIGSKDGTKVFCVPNSCPHLGTPLETGMVERRPCPKPFGPNKMSNSLSTNDDTKTVIDDGLEECIVCPLHRTAFSLDTGEVRGEWCPYPPVIGKIMGTVKPENNLTTFKMRTRGKFLEIKITSELEDD